MTALKTAFMTFSTPDWSLNEILSFCQQTGYDGIEPRVEAGHKHGIELSLSSTERADVRKQAEDSGIALGCLATSIKHLQPDQDSHEMTLNYLDFAVEVGCPMLRVFGGGENGVDQKNWAAGQRGRLAEALAKLAPEAEARGVGLALETHDFWTNTHWVAEVLKQVDSLLIGTNWDFSHCHRVWGQEPEESYGALGGHILHVHWHGGYATPDGRFAFVPLGDERNEWDHHSALRLLKNDGFDGFLSAEFLRQWDKPRQELPRELAALKSIEAAVS